MFFWILAVLFSLAMGYWVYVSDRKSALPYPWLTGILRTLVIFLTCLLLLAPAVSIDKNEIQKPVILFLQDNSASVPFALKADSAQYRKNAERLLKELSRDYRVIKWGFGNKIQPDTLFDYRQQATDISGALSDAVEFYGQQNLGAVILASDGRYNQGANPLFRDFSFDGNIYAVSLGDTAAVKDLRIGKVYANKTVSLNSQFEIRADIIGQKVQGYQNNIVLYEKNGSGRQSLPVSVTSDRFDRTVSFKLKAESPGIHHYILEIPPSEGELNTTNNRSDIFVEVVSDKKKILLAARAPHPDINAIREAISGMEMYELEVRTGDDLPPSFNEYQIIILHSLPSQQYPLRQLSAVKKPLWLIMGGGSDNAGFNRVQDLAALNVNPFNLQNLSAVYNNDFTAFSIPGNIRAVMDKMPPLSVPAGMAQPLPGAVVLMASRGNNMPLWLLKQGSRPAALLIGEGIWRWRLFEFRFFNNRQTVDELIRQTVSFLSVNAQERPFQVTLSKNIWSDREAVYMDAYLLNANNEFINTPEASLVLTDSTGNKETYDFERAGNAYRLNLGLRAAGNYNYVATTHFNGEKLTSAGSFLVQNMPLELMETGVDYPLLYQIAKKNQGAVVPASEVFSLKDSIEKNPAIKPLIKTHSETIPLVDWKWYFFLILLIAAGEWLLRKYWMS